MTGPAPQSQGHGIHQIPIPLPFQSPPWVNAYVIETDTGLLLLDCGADWDEGRAALSDGFAALGLEESSVHTLLASHLHPDHVGMSRRFVNEVGCRFVMHDSAAALVEVYNDTPGYVESLGRMARAHGVPDSIRQASLDVVRPEYMPLIDPPDHTVADGDEIDLGSGRRLEVIHTPGHDAAHICLRDSRTGILFSGDHILPRISPVIMYAEGAGDVLGEYLGSLERLLGMGIATVYPAHGEVMGRGDERARQILLHHDRRLLDMAALVREGTDNAWHIMQKSFRPNLTAIEARLAFLETIAHLEHLRAAGRLRATERDGRIFYTT